jgi:hypothetical protein
LPPPGSGALDISSVVDEENDQQAAASLLVAECGTDVMPVLPFEVTE